MKILTTCLLALVACGRPPVTARVSPAAGPTMLRVDHAWVKDSADPATQARQRASLDALRSKVMRGESFVVAWQSLGVDPGPWHVAEGETYDAAVLPAGARDVPVGQVSSVLAGNGGLHLFRILGREPAT